jgi:hypothetical protein
VDERERPVTCLQETLKIEDKAEGPNMKSQGIPSIISLYPHHPVWATYKRKNARKGVERVTVKNAAYMLKAYEYPRRTLKKSAIGVLGPFSYSRSPPYASPPDKGFTLRDVSSHARPYWTGLFEHPGFLTRK